jgi:hypothetical protein
MQAHRDQDNQPEVRRSGRRKVIAAVVIGAILLVIVVLHLTAGMALHNP